MEKRRYIEFDIMRILACFGVIMIHAAVFEQDSLYAYNTWENQSIKVWGVLSRWAVPAFVMLSGMMILPKAEDTSIKKLLWRRVIRMLVVYVVWSAAYSAYNIWVLGKVYASTKLITFIDGCFSGELHMWYIPMTAGLYIASPILGILVKNMSRKWTIYYLLGLFVFSSLIPFMVKLDITFISGVIALVNGYMDLKFLGGWTLYFVLGYYIRQHSFTKKERIAVYAAALCALAYTLERTVLYGMRTGAAYGVQNYEYPNIYLMGIGIMVFFKEEVSRLRITPRCQKLIESLSGLTFGIYLIHVLLLRVLYALGINLQIAHPIISVPGISLAVFAIGALITWLIHKIPVVGKYVA